MNVQQSKNWKGPAICWCLRTLEDKAQCNDCREIMKDIQTYQYYRSSMEIQPTYKVQIEENDIRVEIGNDAEKYTTCGSLSNTSLNQLKDFLNKNINSFATTTQELIHSDQHEHCIFTEEVPPVALKPYRTSNKDDQYIQQEIQSMLEQGIIKPSRSQWSSPVVLVRKKNGKLRFCVDYRKLNDVTIKDRYPLPRIDELLESLGGATWYTTLDLASGYWQFKV